MKGYVCIICNKPMPGDYEPDYCCNGDGCGCMGLPPHPVCCSIECENAVYDFVGKSFDQRRILAGIKIYQADIK